MITPTDLILVCVLPGPRDLEIARLLGWYRIPFRTAPKVVAVDALAFYQPGTFGESGGRIEYLAPVRGYELTTRGGTAAGRTGASARRRGIFQDPAGSAGTAAAPDRGG